MRIQRSKREEKKRERKRRKEEICNRERVVVGENDKAVDILRQLNEERGKSHFGSRGHAGASGGLIRIRPRRKTHSEEWDETVTITERDKQKREKGSKSKQTQGLTGKEKTGKRMKGTNFRNDGA